MLLQLKDLNENERILIQNVLKRNEELQRINFQRLSELKNEIKRLKVRGALRPGSDGDKSCRRCRKRLGFVFDTGAVCPRCLAKVCRECRRYLDSDHIEEYPDPYVDRFFIGHYSDQSNVRKSIIHPPEKGPDGNTTLESNYDNNSTFKHHNGIAGGGSFKRASFQREDGNLTNNETDEARLPLSSVNDRTRSFSLFDNTFIKQLETLTQKFSDTLGSSQRNANHFDIRNDANHRDGRSPSTDSPNMSYLEHERQSSLITPPPSSTSMSRCNNNNNRLRLQSSSSPSSTCKSVNNEDLTNLHSTPRIASEVPWVCVLCYKLMEYACKSGEWFYPNNYNQRNDITFVPPFSSDANTNSNDDIQQQCMSISSLAYAPNEHEISRVNASIISTCSASIISRYSTNTTTVLTPVEEIPTTLVSSYSTNRENAKNVDKSPHGLISQRWWWEEVDENKSKTPPAAASFLSPAFKDTVTQRVISTKGLGGHYLPYGVLNVSMDDSSDEKNYKLDLNSLIDERFGSNSNYNRPVVSSRKISPKENEEAHRLGLLSKLKVMAIEDTWPKHNQGVILCNNNKMQESESIGMKYNSRTPKEEEDVNNKFFGITPDESSKKDTTNSDGRSSLKYINPFAVSAVTSTTIVTPKQGLAKSAVPRHPTLRKIFERDKMFSRSNEESAVSLSARRRRTFQKSFATGTTTNPDFFLRHFRFRKNLYTPSKKPEDNTSPTAEYDDEEDVWLERLRRKRFSLPEPIYKSQKFENTYYKYLMRQRNNEHRGKASTLFDRTNTMSAMVDAMRLAGKRKFSDSIISFGGHLNTGLKLAAEKCVNSLKKFIIQNSSTVELDEEGGNEEVELSKNQQWGLPLTAQDSPPSMIGVNCLLLPKRRNSFLTRILSSSGTNNIDRFDQSSRSQHLQLSNTPTLTVGRRETLTTSRPSSGMAASTTHSTELRPSSNLDNLIVHGNEKIRKSIKSIIPPNNSSIESTQSSGAGTTTSGTSNNTGSSSLTTRKTGLQKQEGFDEMVILHHQQFPKLGIKAISMGTNSSPSKREAPPPLKQQISTTSAKSSHSTDTDIELAFALAAQAYAHANRKNHQIPLLSINYDESDPEPGPISLHPESIPVTHNRLKRFSQPFARSLDTAITLASPPTGKVLTKTLTVPESEGKAGDSLSSMRLSSLSKLKCLLTSPSQDERPLNPDDGSSLAVVGGLMNHLLGGRIPKLSISSAKINSEGRHLHLLSPPRYFSWGGSYGKSSVSLSSSTGGGPLDDHVEKRLNDDWTNQMPSVVSGEILLSLHYKVSLEALEVHILECRDLYLSVLTKPPSPPPILPQNQTNTASPEQCNVSDRKPIKYVVKGHHENKTKLAATVSATRKCDDFVPFSVKLKDVDYDDDNNDPFFDDEKSILKDSTKNDSFRSRRHTSTTSNNPKEPSSPPILLSGQQQKSLHTLEEAGKGNENVMIPSSRTTNRPKSPLLLLFSGGRGRKRHSSSVSHNNNNSPPDSMPHSSENVNKFGRSGRPKPSLLKAMTSSPLNIKKYGGRLGNKWRKRAPGYSLSLKSSSLSQQDDEECESPTTTYGKNNEKNKNDQEERLKSESLVNISTSVLMSSALKTPMIGLLKSIGAPAKDTKVSLVEDNGANKKSMFPTTPQLLLLPPNPYIKTYLLPGRGRETKRKTKVKYKTSKPIFNEMLDYRPVYPEQLREHSLELSVYHREVFGRNIILGRVVIPLKDYDFQDLLPKWYKLKYPSSSFEVSN